MLQASNAITKKNPGDRAYMCSTQTFGVVSYFIERASGLAKRTIARTKITMDLAQKTIGSTTLYSQ